MNPILLNETRRVIVIDDNDAIHADFRKILTGGGELAHLADDEAALFGQSKPVQRDLRFEVETALQGREGYEKVKAARQAGRPFHLAFVDMRMPPGWDGVETIKHLWETDPDLQVVICSAYSDYSWEQIVLQLGTSDKLLILKKPFDELEVCQIATALTAKWLLNEQAELKMSEMESLIAARTAELKQASLVDKLTGLPNRELLNDRLSQLINHCRRDPERRFAVLFLDFDRFKVVNDSLGHEIGDLLLIGIAERLRAEVRNTDTISGFATAARLGGDEFILVLDHLRDYHDAARVTERLLERLSVPYRLKGHLVHSTVSIGVTNSSPNYENPEEMIRDADTAMYRAKAAGKARYMLFDQQMHADAVVRLTLENDLRQAIDGNQLLLHYQPILSLLTSQTIGFETLVRWQHPSRGLVPPLQFIPLAEEIGMIVPLGYWVLNEACRQLSEWRRRLPEFAGLSVSVNLSRKQLTAPNLVERIDSILKTHALPPAFLKLEITESVIMEDTDESIHVLDAIRRLGIELHMDDFGTGYSSLSCLHRFPINGLKIDRAFVEDIQSRRDTAALVRAIVSLAHDLGVSVVAEGLETPAQLAFLQALDCDHGQGYLFSRPLPARAAEEFVRIPWSREKVPA